VGAVNDENFKWPNADVPNFQSSVSSIYQCLMDLSARVLSIMAIGLKMEPNSFAFAYEKMGTHLGGAQLRYNYYPMITDPSQIKPGQIRCGEHTDYGGITLLIQDDAGGLEVRDIHVKEYTYGDFVIHQRSLLGSPIRLSKTLKLYGRGLNRWTSLTLDVRDLNLHIRFEGYLEMYFLFNYYL